MFVQAISMFGRMACSIYAMISGYFLIGRRTVDLSKAVLIVFDVIFFTAVIAIVAWVTGLAQVTARDLIYSGLYWYIVFYLIFYFFTPFVNRLLCSLERSIFVKLLALMFLFWSVIPTLTFQKIKFSELDFFIVMYTAGAFIRLHVHGKVHYRNRRNLLISLGAAAFMVLSVVAFDKQGKATGKDFFVENACYFREFNTIPAVVCSVFLFLYFLDFQFYSSAINFVAGSTLHILMIHLNEFLRRWIWTGIYPNAEYIGFPYFHAPIKILCVFIGCFAASAVYRLTVRRIAEKAVMTRMMGPPSGP